jgi:hypothetical protein
VAVLELGGALCGLAAAEGVERDERDAGQRLGRALAVQAPAGAQGLLLFYDSIREPATATTRPVMNASRPLFAGLGEGLEGCPPVVGAGVLGDIGFGPTWQFCGDSVRRGHAVGALLGGELRLLVQVMHGCTPMDGVPHGPSRPRGSCRGCSRNCSGGWRSAPPRSGRPTAT